MASLVAVAVATCLASSQSTERYVLNMLRNSRARSFDTAYRLGDSLYIPFGTDSYRGHGVRQDIVTGLDYPLSLASAFNRPATPRDGEHRGPRLRNTPFDYARLRAVAAQWCPAHTRAVAVAVHLRAGDALCDSKGKHCYNGPESEFVRVGGKLVPFRGNLGYYVPPSVYEHIARDLEKRGAARHVVLVFGARVKLKETAKYVRRVRGIFVSRGFRVDLQSAGADLDFCSMVHARVLVPSGGSFSHIAGHANPNTVLWDACRAGSASMCERTTPELLWTVVVPAGLALAVALAALVRHINRTDERDVV